MPSLSVVDMEGKNVGTIELAESVFGIEPNAAVMHQMVVNYLAAQRQGTQSTLTRAEVSGGGRKPWRQKGTGRARQGSTRAPQWTHGGVVFAPKPRDYRFSVNKKVRRLAMKSALSAKFTADEMIVLDSFELEAVKTKEVAKTLAAVGAGKKTLIVLPEKDDTIFKSARNIAGVKVALVNTLNVYDMLNCTKILFLKDAVAKVEEVYA